MKPSEETIKVAMDRARMTVGNYEQALKDMGNGMGISESIQFNEALVRMSMKECKDLLKMLRSDFAKGIYVKEKEFQLIEKIIIIDVHIKRMVKKRPVRSFLQFIKDIFRGE